MYNRSADLAYKTYWLNSNLIQKLSGQKLKSVLPRSKEFIMRKENYRNLTLMTFYAEWTNVKNERRENYLEQ